MGRGTAWEFEANQEDLQPGLVSQRAVRADLQRDDWRAGWDLQGDAESEWKRPRNHPIDVLGDRSAETEEGRAGNKRVFDDLRSGGEAVERGLDKEDWWQSGVSWLIDLSELMHATYYFNCLEINLWYFMWLYWFELSNK